MSASLAWPTVPGSVLSCEFQTVRVNPNGTNIRTSYTAKMRYGYAVASRQYESSRIAWGIKSGYPSPEAPQAFVEAHPAGSKVMVHYNPSDPSDAVLDPTGKLFGFMHVNLARVMAWTLGLLGLVLIGVAAATA